MEIRAVTMATTKTNLTKIMMTMPTRMTIANSSGNCLEQEGKKEMLVKGSENIKIAPFPDQASKFCGWKLNIRHVISAACKKPEEALAWLNKVETSTFEELSASG